MSDITSRINGIWKEMRSQFKERDAEATGLMVAVLARQHLLMIAAPGTAKTAMLLALANAIEGARTFVRLLTKFSVPEEVFGAVKLSALKQDKFERSTKGKLPEAHFALIDEIFRSNSALLNMLLTAVNERLFDNDGQRVQIPLETVVGASNSLPEEGGELQALFDRFLLRYVPAYIQEDANFVAMLKAPEPTLSTKLTLDELHRAQAEAAKIQIPADVYNVIVSVRKSLGREGIIASDRRYKWTLSAIRAHAYLHGRQVVSSDDVEILTACLWDEPAQRAKVNAAVLSVSNPLQQQADAEWDAVLSALQELTKATKDKDDKEGDKRAKTATEVVAKLRKSKDRLEKLRKEMESAGRDTAKLQSYVEQIKAKSREIFSDELNIDP